MPGSPEGGAQPDSTGTALDSTSLGGGTPSDLGLGDLAAKPMPITELGPLSDADLGLLKSPQADEASGLPPEEAIRQALSSGQAVPFTNSVGSTVDVAIASRGSSGGFDQYGLTIGGHPLAVKVPEGQDPTANLGRLVDYYTQQPAGVRPEIESITIDPGRNPQDAYWAQRYRRADFMSAATAGGGNITFWNNGTHISQGVFDHEVGHLFASQLSGSRANLVPPGWEGAIGRDASVPTDYARSHAQEDFAESYMTYRQANREGPEALQRFRESYPARAEALDGFEARAGQPRPPADNSTALGRFFRSIFG